jgi:hypothetical protein
MGGLFTLPGACPGFHENIDMRNHVECDPLGKLLCLHFIEREHRLALREQFVHRFLAGAGNGLICREHDTLDPRLVVQRLERDDELRG